MSDSELALALLNYEQVECLQKAEWRFKSFTETPVGHRIIEYVLKVSKVTLKNLLSTFRQVQYIFKVTLYLIMTSIVNSILYSNALRTHITDLSNAITPDRM
jgi:hypothetical protein